MEFGLLMADIPVYGFCKFEMYIFKTTLVISENVYIAFLYVLSILITTYHKAFILLKLVLFLSFYFITSDPRV